MQIPILVHSRSILDEKLCAYVFSRCEPMLQNDTRGGLNALAFVTKLPHFDSTGLSGGGLSLVRCF